MDTGRNRGAILRFALAIGVLLYLSAILISVITESVKDSFDQLYDSRPLQSS